MVISTKTFTIAEKTAFSNPRYSILLFVIFSQFTFLSCACAEPQKQNDNTEPFVIIKNKTPQEMFEDANYLYQLGEYERSLVLFNKVFDQSSEVALKRKARMAAEVINVLLKAERVNPQEAVKEAKKAAKIKKRLDADRVSSLYKEAFRCLYNEDYEKSISIFKEILVLEPREVKARQYIEARIPSEFIKVLYDKAISAFNKADYEEAIKIFYKILALDPGQKEAKEYIDKKISPVLNGLRIKSLREEAKNSFASAKYEESLLKFKEILAIEPNEPEAREYIEVRIPASLMALKVKALYKDALSDFSMADYKSAEAKFRGILALVPGELKAKEYVYEKIPQVYRDLKIKSILEEAKKAFDNGSYEEASDKFNAILALDSSNIEAKDYAVKRLPEVFQSLKIKSLYERAKAEFKDAKYEEAFMKFKEIISADPSQSEAKDYAENKIPPLLLDLQVKALLKDACLAFDTGDYTASLNKFSEALKLDRGNSQAKEYIEKKIPAALALAKNKAMQEEAVRSFDGGRFEEAVSKFSALLGLEPANLKAQEYMRKKIPRVLKEVKVKALYKEADEAYQKGSVDEAGKKRVLAYLYETALQSYEDGNVRTANEYFKRVVFSSPQERLAQAYLTEAK